MLGQVTSPDDQPYAAIRVSLDAAADSTDPADALPHLRSAADRLSGLIDETMAHAVVTGRASIRSVGAGVERARYDQETGRQPEPVADSAESTQPRPPMRFRPRRTT